MPKNDAVKMDGTIIDTLPNSQFTVRLDNGHELLAYTGGRMRRFRFAFAFSWAIASKSR